MTEIEAKGERLIIDESSFFRQKKVTCVLKGYLDRIVSSMKECQQEMGKTEHLFTESKESDRWDSIEREIDDLKETHKELKTKLKTAEKKLEESSSQLALYQKQTTSLAQHLAPIILQVDSTTARQIVANLEKLGVSKNNLPQITHLDSGSSPSFLLPEDTSQQDELSHYQWRPLSNNEISNLKTKDRASYHRYQLGKYLSPKKFATMVKLKEFIDENTPSLATTNAVVSREIPVVSIAKEMLFELLKNYKTSWGEFSSMLFEKCPSEQRSSFRSFNEFLQNIKDFNDHLKKEIKEKDAYAMFNTAYHYGHYLPKNPQYASHFKDQHEKEVNLSKPVLQDIHH